MTTLSSLFGSYDGNLPWLEHRIILCGLVGSRGYGIHTESSDWDYRGICIPPKEYILGNLHTFHQAKFLGENTEVEIFNIKKFFTLAVDCNPNILEMLFLEEYLPLPKFQEKFLGKLLDIRNLFLSQKAKHTFGGYAYAQLKRMETHRKWLLHPPSHNPTREEFGLSPFSKLVSKEELGSIEAVEKRGEDISQLYSEEVLSVYFRERQYANKKREWDQFINWKENRNKERAALEEKCGYDCYLEEGTEFLTEAGWKTYREAQHLQLATLNGDGQLEYQYPYETIRKKYSGDLYRCFTLNSHCIVTSNHRMLVAPVSRSKKNNFSCQYLGKEKWEFSSLDSLLENRKSHYFTRVSFNDVVDEEYPINNETLILIGAYVSEGHIEKKLKNGDASVLGISQKEDGRLCQFMDSLIGKVEGLRKYSHKRKDRIGNFITYYISNKTLSNFLVKHCGKYSRSKKLPTFITRLSPSQAQLLLDVLMSGDGTEREYSKIYYTISKELADGVQILGLLSGRPSKVWGPYGKMYQVYVGDKKEVDIIKYNKNSHHITHYVAHDEYIVCFSVPNETLITRRDGKVSIQGNSKHASHLVRLLTMGNEILIKGELIVKRTWDRDVLCAIRNGVFHYEVLMDQVGKLQQLLEKAYVHSSLPHGPPRQLIDEHLVNILEEAYYGWK